MSLILHIDTAVQAASLCLSDGELILDSAVNPSEKESATWLHQTIRTVLQRNQLSPRDLCAVAISTGPGSYTGLRVGLASAKGLCYALSIPLISINTLQMMAAAVPDPPAELLCPMIDARRMEVFTALYTTSLAEVMQPVNLVLDENSFQDWLSGNTILFFGNGSKKAEDIIKHSNASFVIVTATAENMVQLAVKKFEAGQFSDLAYSEPFYGKDFHSSISKKNY